MRAKKPDGSWGPWYEAENLEGVGDGLAGAARHRAGLRRPHHHGADRGHPPGRRTASGAQTAERRPKPGLGYVPANTEQPFGQNVNAVLISPPQAPVEDLPLPNAVTPPGQPPNIITRAQWGADESMRCPNTGYDNGVRAGIVHHTAGSNDYAPQDSAAIVRSIYEYHTRTLGWCDIAYNALVDKYGQVFEGRAGGMDKTGRGRPHRRVQPEHLGCGDDRQLRHRAADPDPVAHHRPAARLAARHRPRRSQGHGRIDLGGGSFTQFPRGATPTLPTIFTHRDVGNTDCPATPPTR